MKKRFEADGFRERISKLEAQLERAEEVLGKYADRCNWDRDVEWIGTATNIGWAGAKNYFRGATDERGDNV